jgi:hypothetical protein
VAGVGELEDQVRGGVRFWESQPCELALASQLSQKLHERLRPTCRANLDPDASGPFPDGTLGVGDPCRNLYRVSFADQVLLTAHGHLQTACEHRQTFDLGVVYVTLVEKALRSSFDFHLEQLPSSLLAGTDNPHRDPERTHVKDPVRNRTGCL